MIVRFTTRLTVSFDINCALDTIKRATREARRYFLDDLRKVENMGFPQVAFIIELFAHLPVNLQTETADFIFRKGSFRWVEGDSKYEIFPI